MISGIVLAAGLSSRMGSLKPLLDWGGEPLICYQVRQLREAGCDEVIVVLGFKADDVSRQMRSVVCRTMLNPRFQHGRAGSLRIGAKAASRDADAILITDVDTPRPAAFYRALIEGHDLAKAYSRPVHNGHRGHPVIVSGRLREELMAADDTSEGLNGVLRAHAAEMGEVEAGDLLDVGFNTPEEYEAAKRRFGIGG
ncbi:MAG TPA: nucleotidyltransferase family protein [Tepidiformaceae bacterium]|nr:nucleotidyltransferase family protein [Tepidiformaceae bacterium]